MRPFGPDQTTNSSPFLPKAGIAPSTVLSPSRQSPPNFEIRLGEVQVFPSSLDFENTIIEESLGSAES